MSKISGQLLISGQYQDNCEISGRALLGTLNSGQHYSHKIKHSALPRSSYLTPTPTDWPVSDG